MPSLYRRRMHPDESCEGIAFAGADPNIDEWGVYQDAKKLWVGWIDMSGAHVRTLPAASPAAALRSLRGQIENLRRAIERLQGKERT